MKVSLQKRFGFLLVASALATGCGKKEVAPNAGGVPVTGAANPGAADKAAAPDALGGGAAKADPAVDKAAAEKVAADNAAIAKVKADKAAAEKAAADKAAAEEAARPPLTAEGLEALVTAMAACKLEGVGIDPGCPEAQALAKELARKDALKGLGEATKTLGLKLLAHESPVLRVKATEFLAARYGGGKEGQAALLAAYDKEKVKEVRIAFVRSFGTFASLNADAAKAILKAMNDGDVDVRAQAIYALTQPLNKQLDGAIDRLIKAVKGDADPKLRRVACEHAGKLGDEKLLPVIAELTKPGADPELAESCMRGLVSMWVDTQRFENASERAYHLTLRLLERTPRTAEMPSWVAISRLEKLDVLDLPPTKLSPADARGVAGWKARAPWYKTAELRRSLREILKDPNASELAAAHSVTALAALGQSKGELEAMRKELANTPRLVAGGPVALAFDRVAGLREDKPGQSEGRKLELKADVPKPGARVKLGADAPPGMKLKVVETPVPAPKQP